jgi:hypothetical protein
MSRPDSHQLYRELQGHRFDFLPHGEYRIQDIYSAVAIDIPNCATIVRDHFKTALGSLAGIG